MRYFDTEKTIRSLANVMRRKRFNAGEMSDYMLRDIGFIDGRPHREPGLAESESRSRRLDLLMLTRYAS